MPTIKLGGRLGTFRDNATNQEVSFNVFGTCECSYPVAPGADPAAAEAFFAGQVMNGIRTVIGQKLAANQIAIQTVIPSLPALLGEMIAASGVEAHGAHVSNLQLNMVQDPPAGAPQMQAPQALPPNPYQATANAFERAAKEKLDPRNYEVHAKMNVGGFNVNMSSDGGVDTAGLKNQLKDKVKTEIIWYGIGCVVLLIVGIGLLGLGWYIYRQVQASNPNASGGGGTTQVAKWDGKSTFTCGGNDHVKLEGVTAKLAAGSGVEAAGNCHLDLVNCQITAPTGIQATAAAVVTVTGGSIDSTTLAVHADGAAQVHLQGTKVKGKTQAVAGAKITGP